MTVDSYDVNVLFDNNNKNNKMMLHSTTTRSYFQQQYVGITVPNSNRNPDKDPPPLCAILAPSAYNNKSVSSKLTTQLLVLPYNFPTLIPLLQQARDIALSQGSHQQGQVKSLSAIINPALVMPLKWQQQMKSYLYSVPPYYYHSLYKAFQPLGIHVFISLLTGASTATAPRLDNCINRVVHKELLNSYHKVCEYIELLERQIMFESKKPSQHVGLGQELLVDASDNDYDTCSELSSFSTVVDNETRSDSVRDYSLSPYSPTRFPSEVDVMLVGQQHVNSKKIEDTSTPQQQQQDEKKHQQEEEKKKQQEKLQNYLKSLRLPLHDPSLGRSNNKSLSPPCSREVPLLVPPSSQDLLLTWENMRGKLYGNKGGGLTVSGLFVAGRLNNTGGGVVRGGVLAFLLLMLIFLLLYFLLLSYLDRR